MLSSLLCIAVFKTVAKALVHDLPRQTSVRKGPLPELNQFPKPTAAPQIQRELRRRQDDLTTAFIGPDQTCGFISRLSGAGHDCDASDYCVLFPATASGFGSVACCDDETNDCTVVTDCIDSSDYYSTTSLCDNGCRLDTNTLKCTESALPYCNSIRFPDAGVDDYVCDSVSISSFQLAFTTFDGENTSEDGRSWDTQVYNADGYFADASTTYFSGHYDISLTGAYPSAASSDTTSFSISSTSSSSSSMSSSTLSSSSTVAGAPASPSSSHFSSSTTTSSPAGAIVGGTIGGVALIALIAVGAFILKRKYQKSDSGSTTSNPPLTQTPGPAYSKSTGASGIVDTANNTPMTQHSEFYKPQTQYQAYSPPAAHQYQAVPTSELPTNESHGSDDTFLPPGSELGRNASTAGVSMLTVNESPSSPTPMVSHIPSTIVEAPGNNEYLEPQRLNVAHGQPSHEDQ